MMAHLERDIVARFTDLGYTKRRLAFMSTDIGAANTDYGRRESDRRSVRDADIRGNLTRIPHISPHHLNY